MVTVKTSPFKSVVVADSKGNDLRIDEGMAISFANLEHNLRVDRWILIWIRILPCAYVH